MRAAAATIRIRRSKGRLHVAAAKRAAVAESQCRASVSDSSLHSGRQTCPDTICDKIAAGREIFETHRTHLLDTATHGVNEEKFDEILLLALAGVATLAGAVPAAAQGVDQREHRQEQRIQQGER